MTWQCLGGIVVLLVGGYLAFIGRSVLAACVAFLGLLVASTCIH